MTEHDEYRELCTAFLTDSLADEERNRFEKHIAGCSECRTALSQYQALVREGLPALAPKLAPGDLADVMTWAPEHTEQKILARLAVESGSCARVDLAEEATLPHSRLPVQTVAHVSSKPSLLSFLPYAAGILLVIGAGFATYHIGLKRAGQVSKLSAPVAGEQQNPLQGQIETLSKERETLNSRLRDRDAAIAQFERKIRQQLQQDAVLEGHLKDANQRAQDEKAKGSVERDDLARRLEQAQASLGDLQTQLASLKQQRSDDTTRVASLAYQIGRLSAELDDRNKTIAEQQQLLASDRDIRELMGARDLYIAEVYDVGKNGERKKPYGRVFYTKGKSLIFYAYDLDQQPGVRNANTFQAWGLRGPDRANALSLGILYVDSATKKRWVLRFDDPKTLEQINAVFVTVEPSGGSAKPSGKPLLFAYLREEPNHP